MAELNLPLTWGGKLKAAIIAVNEEVETLAETGGGSPLTAIIDNNGSFLLMDPEDLDDFERDTLKEFTTSANLGAVVHWGEWFTSTTFNRWVPVESGLYRFKYEDNGTGRQNWFMKIEVDVGVDQAVFLSDTWSYFVTSGLIPLPAGSAFRVSVGMLNLAGDPTDAVTPLFPLFSAQPVVFMPVEWGELT